MRATIFGAFSIPMLTASSSVSSRPMQEQRRAASGGCSGEELARSSAAVLASEVSLLMLSRTWSPISRSPQKVTAPGTAQSMRAPVATIR